MAADLTGTAGPLCVRTHPLCAPNAHRVFLPRDRQTQKVLLRTLKPLPVRGEAEEGSRQSGVHSTVETSPGVGEEVQEEGS